MKEKLISALLDPLTISIIMSWVIYAVKQFVEKTESKKDDAILASALKAFSFAEKFIPDNTENKTLSKIDQALKEFEKEYEELTNKSPDAKAIGDAKQLFSVFAGQQKGIA